jgi:hypothetical protein
MIRIVLDCGIPEHIRDYCNHFCGTVLWIRIDLIRIQKFITIRIPVRIRIHNSTLEQKIFQRLKINKKVKDIISLYRYYFYTGTFPL